MIFYEKKITLKNNITAVLKTPEIADAQLLLECIKTACGETDFLLHGAEDWEDVTVANEESWIKKRREADNELVIACYVDGKPVGSCDITFYDGRKNYHRAGIGISIVKKYWNLGIGSAMFEELLKAAKEHKRTEIVELEFVEGNERAKALYEKFGFETVSKLPNAYKLKDGTYQNKIYMQKYL